MSSHIRPMSLAEQSFVHKKKKNEKGNPVCRNGGSDTMGGDLRHDSASLPPLRP